MAKARPIMTVTMTGVHEYEAPSYGGYGYETRYVYTMSDEVGNVYVWKTSAVLYERVEAARRDAMEYDETTDKWYAHKHIQRGDIIRITATIKGESEYKGVRQTVLSRVKLIERVYDAEQDRMAHHEARKTEQANSIKPGDIVWEMPYRQYKEHYADCETVIDSFNSHDGQCPATIRVIIREGRLKASGVRGQHYSGYEFYVVTGTGEKLRVVYRAISEETALRRLGKEYPDAQDVTPGKVYQYCGL